MKKIFILLILAILFVSCRDKVCPSYTNTGNVYYPYPNKHIHGESWTTTSKTNNHFLKNKLR
jgi:hypothetical protein